MDRDEIRRMYAAAKAIAPAEKPKTTVGHTDNTIVIQHKEPTSRVMMDVDGAMYLAMVILMECCAVRELQAAKAEERKNESRIIKPNGPVQ